MQKDELIEKLYEIGAVKFGSFTLKSEIVSPIYIDLRLVVSYPALLEAIAEMLWKKITGCTFDVICGVPYTALPIATAMSIKQGLPMIMRRKEVKGYGTKKTIEGVYRAGDTCLVIEDLVTSGSSVFETVDCLNHENIRVTDVAFIIDREQGGAANLKGRNLTSHSLFTLTEMLKTLEQKQKINTQTVCAVREFIEDNQTTKMV